MGPRTDYTTLLASISDKYQFLMLNTILKLTQFTRARARSHAVAGRSKWRIVSDWMSEWVERIRYKFSAILIVCMLLFIWINYYYYGFDYIFVVYGIVLGRATARSTQWPSLIRAVPAIRFDVLCTLDQCDANSDVTMFSASANTFCHHTIYEIV